MRQELAAILTAAGVAEPRRESSLLLAHVLDRPLAFLYANPDFVLEERQISRLRGLAGRRAGREPLAWLTGRADFAGLTFLVGPGVLVPRPDSEILVETARAIGQTGLWPARQAAGGMLRILDTCTGTGCIGISLAAMLEKDGCRISLTLADLDSQALEYARQNLARCQLAGETALCRADLFPDQAGGPPVYDLIVANPPYIPSADIAGLMPEVSAHEPLAALDGGPDGLLYFRRLIAGAADRLDPGGWLLLEHGFDQAAAVGYLLQASGFADLITGLRDYGGQPRVSGGRRPLI